jgi:hypothetical protein
MILSGDYCGCPAMHGILALPGVPGFPVEVECSDELHAPFFTEKRINNAVEGCEAGNPGSHQATRRMLDWRKK